MLRFGAVRFDGAWYGGYGGVRLVVVSCGAVM